MTGVIAIDGPSGSGKSSVSKGVAMALGYEYLDTGAMYRAAAWYMHSQGIDVTDPDAVAASAFEPDIASGTDPSAPTIAVDGIDVGEAIRTDEVTSAVSHVASVPEVRHRLVRLQREVAEQARSRGHGIVVEGRDIGSVVFPDAPLKVYLTADQAVRAQRRAAENAARDDASSDVAATAAILADRDARDAARATSPLVRADGAYEVDATYLDLQGVIDKVLSLVPEGL